MIYDIIAWVIIGLAFFSAGKQFVNSIKLFKKGVNACALCSNSDCALKNMKNNLNIDKTHRVVIKKF